MKAASEALNLFLGDVEGAALGVVFSCDQGDLDKLPTNGR